MRKLCSLLALLALGAEAQEKASPADREGIEFFEKKIRPVLVERCYSCHSAEAKKLKGALYLDSRDGLLKGGDTGPAIVPGDPAKSLLIKAIKYADEELKMPPKGRLANEVVADFAAWIQRGAPDPRGKGATAAAKKEINIEAGKSYWAFQPLHPGKGSTVDEYILAKLHAAGIKPNPQADQRRLIRRATLDLLGIPPTPEEVDAFLAAPDYGRLIDRLLARPEYGERWARHWLDVARFAESHGFEQDYDRENAYHYRDFLIQAFNRDLPYDRFVQWQVAGDELAPDEPLAWMATGFLGAGAFPTQLTETEFESARYDELDSMASTTSSAFLGLSIGCARCHDHKFDPFPSRDYYRFASTFTSTIRAMAELHMDPEGDKAALAKWEGEHPPLVAALQKFEREELPGRFDHWVEGRPWETQEMPAWTILDLVETKSQGGATFRPQPDGSVLATGENPKNDKWTFKARTSLKGISAVRLEALKDPSLKKGGPGRADNGNFALSDFRVTVDGRPVKLTAGKFSHQQNASNLSAAASVDGDKVSGWAVDPQFGKDHAVVFEFAEPVGPGELVFDFEFNNNSQHSIGRPRLSLTTRPKPELAGEAKTQPIVELCETLRAGTKPGPEALAVYGRIDAEALKQRKAVEAHLAAKPAPKLTKVLVATEGLKPLKHHADDRGFPHFYKETYVLSRGDVNKKQGVAPQGFIQVLMRAPEQEKRWIADVPSGSRTPGRRAALAKWLTDVDAGAGALTARVIVNRLWAQHFGRGIVATPNDFGVQGEPPSHPELLEWLASELIRNNWQLKPIHKLLMTSAVYLQSSDLAAESTKRDPDNKLYWRRDPRRLEAEAVRDSLLEVGGLLDRKMYGPGTLDENMSRRSIYFFIKRSRLIPMMMVFDAPEPLVSQGGRPTTTIAPQALLFMNSPLVRRAAAGLAKQVKDRDLGIVYRRTLGRGPTTQEMVQTALFMEQQTASYRASGRSDPEGSALVDLCQALLCMNEFVYVD
jgi:cytochrome c553